MNISMLLAVLSAVAISYGNAAGLWPTTAESRSLVAEKVASPDPPNPNALTLQKMIKGFPNEDVSQYLSKDVKAECNQEFQKVCENAKWPCPCREGTLNYGAVMKMHGVYKKDVKIKIKKTEMYPIDSKTIVMRYKISAKYKGKRTPLRRFIEIFTFDDQGKIVKVKFLLRHPKGGPASQNVETTKRFYKAFHGGTSQTSDGGKSLTTFIAKEMANDVQFECGESKQTFCKGKDWCPCKDGKSLDLAGIQKAFTTMQTELKYERFKSEFFVVDAKTVLVRTKFKASYKGARIPADHFIELITFNDEGKISKIQPYPELKMM